MRRFAIFAFYDEDGIVDDYIDYLMQESVSLFEKLVIVCNGNLSEDGMERFKKYSENIIIRKNIGFDAGAYKDVIIAYEKEIRQFDELILFNNSFYGPLYPLEPYYKIMEEKDNDFWGFLASDSENGQPEFLHSYYLAFKQKILLSDIFWEFWTNLNYPEKFWDAVVDFELTITKLLKDNNFKYNAYVEHYSDSRQYLDYFELLSLNKYPWVKYKAINIINYPVAEKVIDYIRENTNYNLKLIKDHELNRKHINTAECWCLNPLCHFVNEHEGFYIYGHGYIGNCIYQCLKKLGFLHKFKGFVVTEAKQSDEQSARELILRENEGIIFGLDDNNSKQVKQNLEIKCKKEQMLWRC